MDLPTFSMISCEKLPAFTELCTVQSMGDRIMLPEIAKIQMNMEPLVLTFGIQGKLIPK